MIKKDIFISYRNDGSGNQFAARLCRDLEEMGYSVSFNPHEQHSESFPERLKEAVAGCTDFILVISKDCIERLKQNNSIDWVREELLTAHRHKKHIIPILMSDVNFPDNVEELPQNLRFLPHIDAFKFPPDEYMESPFAALIGVLKSKQDGLDLYRDTYNNNEKYNVTEEYISTLEKAKAGDLNSMYEIGMMCFYGMATKEQNVAAWDYSQAAYWLKRVSDSGSPHKSHADCILARMYYNGTVPGESQSYEKAYEYHHLSADGDPYSASSLAFMMRVGLGCEFNFDEILNYYDSDVLKKGDDMAVLAFGDFLSLHGRFEDAIKVYDSIGAMSPAANYQLGMLYKRGVHCEPPMPDYIRASYYLRNAADNNHYQAAFEYGLMCFRPTGQFRKNFNDAERYLKIAADGGVAEAQYVLGFMYKSGHVEKNLEKAVSYLEMARRQGHSLSALELASIYQQQECANYERAYQCAQIAASHGVAEGELILGNLLFFGRGCEADMDKAYEYYSKAFAHGIFYASVMLGKIERLRKEKH